MTTLGIPKCEIKTGCSEIAPSLAAIASASAKLVARSSEMKRGRNLPKRRQNSTIFWRYPGATESCAPMKDSFFNCEMEICFWEASGWSSGRVTKLGTLASLCV